MLIALLPAVSSCTKKRVYYYPQQNHADTASTVTTITTDKSKILYPHPPTSPPLLDSRDIKENLSHYYSEWQGTPYRNGGMSHSGIDCSAFTYLAYRDLFTIELPRTVAEQAGRGRKISRNELKPGDLVFFKTGFFQRHVGIYLEDLSFMHVSTIKGVMISRLDDQYWKNKYWKSKRLLM